MDFHAVPMTESAPDDEPKSSKEYLEQKTLQIVFQWVKGYLSKPHKDLGREGPVCPFTPPTIKVGKLWVAVSPVEAVDFESVSAVSLEAKAFFLEAPDEPGEQYVLKAVIVAFPQLENLAGYQLIEGVQRALKPQFVEKGLMFGQFYKGCPEPGLINPAFHPLTSPIPLLAVRYMVKADEVFLRKTPELMRFYHQRFPLEAFPQG